LAELRLSEVAIINQVKVAEVALAETTVATSAEIQAAYKVRAAAAAGYAETTLAANEAIALSDKATAAATATSRSVAAVSAAGGGLMGLLTGPVGLIATAGLVALSFFNFGKGTDAATQALIDQHATVDESIKKFEELGAATQRVQRLTWIDEQKEALKEASSALDDYTYKVERGIAFRDDGADKFRAMINEVKSGQRDLSSVTSWLESTIKLYPESEKELAKLTQTYDNSTTRAGELAKVLKGVTTESGNTAKAATTLATAQQTSAGQSAANVAAWDKYYSQLIKTRDLLGANTEAEAAYTAARMGATPAQIAAAKLIGEQTDTLKAYQEAIKQSNEVEKAALRIKLASLYAAEDAQNDAAAAQKKALEDTAKAAEASAGRQVTAMQQVIDQTLRAVQGQNLLLVQPQKPSNLSGAALLTFGGATPTAPVVPRASPDERATVATAQLDATTEANKRVDKAANAAAAALKAQAKALDDLLAKSGISTQAANDMADAYLGGADNVRAMTIQQKIEEELLKTGAGARDKVTKAINDMQDAEDRRDVAKAAAAMKVEVDQTLAQAKATLQGSDALEVYNVNKSMQVELAGKNIQYGSKEYDQLLKQTKAQLEANKALEAANKANDLVDRLNPQVKLLKDYTEDQKALNAAMALYPEKADTYRDALVKLGNEYEVNRSKATIWGQLTEGAIDRIDQAFASAWANIGSGAGSLWDDLKKGFKQTLGEIAHMLTTKPLLNSISNWLTGTDNGQGLSSVWSKLFSSVSGSSSGSGGGGMSFGSAFSTARTAVDGLSSNFGKAVLQGWNGGDGPIAGIEGAFKNGADYISTTLTSAFNTGSQAAAGVLTDGVYNLSSNTAVATVNLETNAVTVGGQTVGTASDLTTTAASSSLETLSVALSYIQGVYTIFQSFQQYGLKGAAVAGGAAAAGAYIGSFFGPLGTAVGFGIGAIAGAFGADKLFGSGEKYPELSTSASGTYSGGKYASKGWVSGWNDGEPKFGNSADAALDSTVQKFTTTLGMIYSAFGSDASVSLSDTMRQRRTSGDYSSGYSATLDNGSQISIVQQHAGGDFVQGLKDNYDDVMGTLLAQSIIGSDSVPAYFKAQFQKFAADWDATAEDVVGAIEGIFTRFNGVNDAIASINVKTLKLDDTGMMASDAVLNLVASISDLDVASATAKDKVKALQDLINTYYGTFFTQEEQFQDLTTRLGANLGAYGVKLPDTREQYRQMVEDIDLTTAAGESLFATLMGLASTADAYYTEIKKRAQDAASSAFSALQRSISAQQKATTDAYNAQVASINDMASTAAKSVSDMTAVSTSLSNALKALNGTSDDAVKQLRVQAQATLQAALATARSGGSLAGFEGLDDALSTVSTNNTDLYSSMEDFARDQGRTANVVAELNALNGKQLTAAEQTAKTLQDQLDTAKAAYDTQMAQYDAELAFGQSQLDALNGVDTSVKSVAAAVAAMNAAVVAALATLPRTGAGSAVANTPQNNANLIDSIYQTVLGRDTSNDAGGAAYWSQMLNSGTLSYDQIAAAIANSAVGGGGTAADAANAGKYLGLPGYATGGLIGGPGTGTSDSIIAKLSNGEYVMSAAAVQMFGTGLLDQMNAGLIPAFATGGAVAGPQLEVTRPSQIYRVSNSSMQPNQGGGAETAEEVRALREEMRIGLAAIALSTKQTSDNTGHLAEVGTQIIGTVDTKVVA
jgi:hypothetical protein